MNEEEWRGQYYIDRKVLFDMPIEDVTPELCMEFHEKYKEHIKTCQVLIEVGAYENVWTDSKTYQSNIVPVTPKRREIIEYIIFNISTIEGYNDNCDFSELPDDYKTYEVCIVLVKIDHRNIAYCPSEFLERDDTLHKIAINSLHRDLIPDYDWYFQTPYGPEIIYRFLKKHYYNSKYRYLLTEESLTPLLLIQNTCWYCKHYDLRRLINKRNN